MSPSRAEVAAAEATAIAQHHVIEAAFRRARLRGRPPKHWLEKLAKLRRSGRLPEECKHLRMGDRSMSQALVDSLEPVAQAYRSYQRSAAGKRGQRVLDGKSIDAKARATHAGKESGATRREEAEADMHVVVDRYYRAAQRLPVRMKPHALAVARWWLSQPVQPKDMHRAWKNPRSLARCLRKSKLAI